MKTKDSARSNVEMSEKEILDKTGLERIIFDALSFNHSLFLLVVSSSMMDLVSPSRHIKT